MTTRVEGTARVTCAVASWAWGLGSRCLVTEVGLHKGGLTTPMNGLWRVDLVAVVDERVDVIEVKGSVADLRREDLTRGKWVLDYTALGLSPWMAVVDAVKDHHLDTLPSNWGLLRVTGTRVAVVRRPGHCSRPPPDAYRILAQVQCLQSLPTMMGLSVSGRAEALFGTLTRPWAKWLPPAPTVVCEEPGNIL